ncbi:hypothetical protein M422DRAFT_39888 [Sphaerobolus stellatus SS14]|uniref:Uncharacterized protein n=1 Tax=Sphaerobolus stellatus (strain SS14) TaxID=990650 RepID=A0A0C9UBT0_SPHS4|nr:hypothetical protein M422DRAFT_39888 [Sphaerobolus stellatus SS14]
MNIRTFACIGWRRTIVESQLTASGFRYPTISSLPSFLSSNPFTGPTSSTIVIKLSVMRRPTTLVDLTASARGELVQRQGLWRGAACSGFRVKAVTTACLGDKTGMHQLKTIFYGCKRRCALGRGKGER